MPRDVEFNYTASDKTGPAAASVARRMKQTGEQVKKDGDKLSTDFGKGIAKLGESISPKLGAALTRGFSSAAEAAPAIIGAGMAAAAPFAGAIISSAIIGGIGAGGIIGGVALAASDPRVKSAFTGVKATIAAELHGASEPFIDTTIDGIHTIGAAIETIDFKSIFADSARQAVPVVEGIASAVEDLGDGVEAVIDRADPVMQQLGDSIAEVGQDTGEFLETISLGADGAAAGLGDLTHTIGTVLDILGPTVLGLTTFYGWLSKIGVAGQFMTGLLGPIGQVADLLDKANIGAGGAEHGFRALDLAAAGAGGTTLAAANAVTQVATSATNGQVAVATFSEQLDALAQSGRNLYDSTTSVGRAVDAVTEAAKRNGATLDANTEKGRANRDALSGLASALVAQYDATVKVNGEGARSQAVAAANREEFIRLAGQFGVAKGKAAELATQLGLIPPKTNTRADYDSALAKQQISAYKTALAGIPRTITTYVQVVRNITGTKDSDSRVAAGLRKQGFDARSSFFAAESGSSSGPARQTMTERLENNITVQLDGAVIYTNTDRQVRARSERDAWRQRVGTR